MMLITGGSGKLGQALQAVFPQALAPTRQQLDLLQPASVHAYIAQHRPDVVLHTAAYTSVAGAEQERQRCWDTNVWGTTALVDALQTHCPDSYGVYISTACVFYGDRGGYMEQDTPRPKNFYGLTKLVGEYVARRLPQHLIVRTNFVAREPWPYPKAFVDRYGTYLYADDVARALQELVAQRLTGLVHLAGADTLSMYDLARLTTPTVLPMRLHEVALPLTADMTLHSTRLPAYRLTRG